MLCDKVAFLDLKSKPDRLRLSYQPLFMKFTTELCSVRLQNFSFHLFSTKRNVLIMGSYLKTMMVKCGRSLTVIEDNVDKVSLFKGFCPLWFYPI